MNKHQIQQKLAKRSQQNCVIIDDNKKWQHNSNIKRISEFFTGDLHDFFDLVNDEQLFSIIPSKCQFLFIGEVFHTLDLQTIVYNFENLHAKLSDNGEVAICISSSSELKSDASQTKIVGRLKSLNGFYINEQIQYIDEEGQEWLMLFIKKQAAKDTSNVDFEQFMKIGAYICTAVNNGKNINKLKRGMIKSNVDVNQFDQIYTSNQEMINYYLLQLVLDLKPAMTSDFLLQLSDFVFTNRKALKVSNISVIESNCFEQAIKHKRLNNPIQTTSFASLHSLVWKQYQLKADNPQLEVQIKNWDN